MSHGGSLDNRQSSRQSCPALGNGVVPQSGHMQNVFQSGGVRHSPQRPRYKFHLLVPRYGQAVAVRDLDAGSCRSGLVVLYSFYDSPPPAQNRQFRQRRFGGIASKKTTFNRKTVTYVCSSKGLHVTHVAPSRREILASQVAEPFRKRLRHETSLGGGGVP